MAKDFSMPVSGIIPNSYRIAMLAVEAQSRFSNLIFPDQNSRVAVHNVVRLGHSARPTIRHQKNSPTENRKNQKRPKTRKGSPWLPNQNHAPSIYPMMPR